MQQNSTAKSGALTNSRGGLEGDCRKYLAAPQGFEPRYADPESAVLPLNEGAVITLCGCAYNSAHLIVWRCYSSVNQTLRQRPLAMFACSLWSSRRKHSPEISTCAPAATSNQSNKLQNRRRPAELRT